MQLSVSNKMAQVYPLCHSFLNDDCWNMIVDGCSIDDALISFVDSLESQKNELGLPSYLPELARLELMIDGAKKNLIPVTVTRWELNPTIHFFESTWKGLTDLISAGNATSQVPPEKGKEIILIWRHPKHNDIIIRTPTDEDLLVLKIVTEDLDHDAVAQSAGVPVGTIDWAFDRSADGGLILAPPSLIRRDIREYKNTFIDDEKFLASDFFTVQWHITQACDLHCRHCYDRSSRSPLKFDQAIHILDDIRAFCKSRHVLGQISFTGGNPFLYPHFFELYQEASEKGFVTGILGNPVSNSDIEKIITIQRPPFYQVSLEGLEQHNDYMRGAGNFNRVLDFLETLRNYGIQSQVSLTLTRDNIYQVLPLAEILKDKADTFTFNRLAQEGEGANLLLPGHDEYRAFINDYVEAAKNNPVISFKDNMINILFYERGMELFGGCAGHGCSAAFNFVAILSDGEVHACRKFPSFIGNVYKQGIAEIYDSQAARRYRSGTQACRSCPIRPVCGGCLAVMHGQGMNIFEDRDPYCFMNPSPEDH